MQTNQTPHKVINWLQKTVLLSLLWLFSMSAFGQSAAKKAKWTDMSNNKNATFYDVQKDFYKQWKEKIREMDREKRKANAKGKALVEDESEEAGYEIYKRWESYMAPRVYPSGDMTLPSTNYSNFINWQQQNAGNRGGGSNSTLSTGKWTELGPVGSPSGPSPYTRTGAGRVNFVRFDPTNTNTMYVGAPDGGLWKSTNGGTLWTTNTDFLTIIGCSDLAIDPTNTQIMYLATGDLEGNRNSLGVFKSTDGGATWNTTAGASWPATNFWKGSKLLMNPSNPLNMLLSTNVGVFRTTDGWATTTNVNFPIGASLDLKDMEFKPGDPNTVYASSDKIYLSTNNGSDWTEVTTGLPSSNVQRIALGVSPGNSAYVYALISKSSNSSFLGLYRSTNSGVSFSLRSSSPNLLGYNFDGLDAGGQGFYDLAVAVSPTNAETVITGGVNHWQSTNGGTTWTNLSVWNSGEVHADIHEINYLTGSGTTVFSCNDGGIFKSTDNGNTFVDISNNLAISQNVGIGLSANVSTTIVNGTQDNGTNLKTGSSWANINGGDGGECFIDPTNNNTIYIQYVQGAFSRSDNGGASNNGITSGLPSGFDFYSTWVMDPVNPNRLYVGGIPTLYTSANQGNLWTALGTPNGTGSIKGIAVAPSNTTIIYIIKDDAVSKSTNSGTSFSNITGTLPVGNASLSSVTVSNTDPNKVWVTFSGYSAGEKVFKSTNGGTTWTNVSAGLPNLPINIVVYTKNTLNDAIYVGADIGVYYLDNSAGSFAPFMTALPNVAVRDLEIFYPTGKLRAGTYGRGVWESDLNTATNFALSISCAGTNNICNGAAAGSATVTVNTGNLPYTYLWSNGNTTANATGLVAGTYTVTVTDALLATSTCSYTVTQPTAIVANCSGTNVTTNGGSDGTASVAPASGGTSTAPFISTNNFPGAPFNIAGPLATVSTVVVPALPAGAIITSATLTINSFNAINPSWQSDSRVSLTGAYTLASTQISLVDAPGTITPNPVINLPGFPSAGGTINLRFSESFDEPGTDATVAGAVITINYTKNGYTYSWSNGNTTTGITGLVAGTYTVTVTDVLGCTNTCAYTVTQPGGSFIITASAGANGSISPSGAVSVTSGANQTFTITPNSCYAIANVLVDGVSQGAIGTYTFTNVTATHTISATFTQLTYNITASAGANGSISPNGVTSVNCGANQTYNITANSCYTIANVIVDGVSQGAIGTYTFTNVTATHTISATFTQLTYNITASAGANGSISPNGVTSVNCGANQTYNITANSCYTIANVIVDGVSQGAIGTFTFTNVTATHTISATFSQLTYNITASAGANGSITPNGVTSVNCGANQTYTITPNGGFNVQDVLVDGVSQGAITTYTFTNVTATHTISATFVSGAFTITASAGANGSISPSGAVSVTSGANQTFNITANSCYTIADVLVDGVSQGAIATYTFTNVTAAHTISATFSQLTYNITASAGANGTISPNGVTSVNCGANQTYTITANSCYTIANVIVDGVSQGAIGTYTFTNVTATHTISATFTQLAYNITASAGANGSISPIGVTSVNCGANQTYTITPNGGFSVQDVLVDGVSQGAITTYTFTNVTATHTINATFVSGAFTITASAGANGSISPSGAVSVTSGANQTFNITANSCYTIADVLVDGVSQGAIGTYTFTNVTATHTISVTFAQLTYNITASAGANGSITPNGVTSVNCGANQTYTITANSCYTIADVLVDGVSQGAIGTYTFTNVTATHTISATFTQLTYNITASAGANGSISPNGVTSVNCGANQTYTITPNGGFNVQDVLVDGISQGAITTYTFTNVTAAHTISATFVSGITNYTITATAGANGTISPNGATTVSSGGNQSYIITANSCYQISDVLVDGVSQGVIANYTFTNVIANHTISASFSLDPSSQSTAGTSATTDAANNNICNGNSTNLTVNGGTLGTGANWKWYSGTCGGTFVGTGASIAVNPNSTRTYFVRAEGACGNTSCVSVTVTVSTSPVTALAIVPFIGMPTNVCNGTTANLSIPAVSKATYYTWDAPAGSYFNGVVSNISPFVTTTPSVTITYGNPSGSLYSTGVQAGNACGNSIRQAQKTRGTVSVPASVNGTLTACANTSGTYSTASVDGASSYLWTITGNATVTGTGTSVTVNFGAAWNGGTLCVAARTSCFTSATKCIAISKSAAALGAISGTFTACPNTIINYSVPASAGAASYNWTLPAGATGSSTSNSINVTFSAGYNAVGSICVSVTSVCGVTSALKCKTVAPGLPSMPASITGATNGLCGQTIVYSCPNQGAASYNLTAPAGATISGNGTRTVSITYGTFTTGSVCVTATNSCGTSAARCVGVKGAPNSPQSLSASPNTWCANATGIQFTANTTNITGSYLLSWLYPASTTYVMGGGNSSSLTLNWGAGNGNVVVIASNACGSGSKSYTATVTCRQGSELNASAPLQVYPNPVSGLLNVSYLSNKGNTQLNVIDVAGRLVLSENKLSVEGINHSVIDLSNIAKGVYTLVVKGSVNTYQERIVLN